MTTRFEMNMIAELACLNMAVMKALSGLAAIAATETGRKGDYLSRILETGLRDLAATRYPDIPDDQLPMFLEMASARYTDLITGIRERPA